MEDFYVKQKAMKLKYNILFAFVQSISLTEKIQAKLKEMFH